MESRYEARYAMLRRWTMKFGALTFLASAGVLVWVTMAFYLYGFAMVY